MSISHSPLTTWSVTDWGNKYLAQNNIREAIWLFQVAVKREEWHAFLFGGIAYLVKQDFPDALDYFLRFAFYANQSSPQELDKKYTSDDVLLLPYLILAAKRGYAQERQNNGCYEKAIELYTQAIADCEKSTISLLKNNANIAELYRARGSVYFKMEEFEYAIADFNLALELLNYPKINDDKAVSETLKSVSEELQIVLKKKHLKLNHFFAQDCAMFICHVKKERGIAYYYKENFELALQDLTSVLASLQKIYDKYSTTTRYHFEENEIKEKGEINDLKRHLAENLIKTHEYCQVIYRKQNEINLSALCHIKMCELYADIDFLLENYSSAYDHYQSAYRAYDTNSIYNQYESVLLAKLTLKDKIIEVIKAIILFYLTPINAFSVSSILSAIPSVSHVVELYKEIKALSGSYQNEKFAKVCCDVVVITMGFIDAQAPSKQLKITGREKFLEFCTAAIELDRNNAKGYVLRAWLYYELAQINNDDHDQMINFYSHVFSDCVAALKRDPYSLKRNPKKNYDYTFLKDMLSKLSAEDLLKIVSPFFIGKRRLLLKQCLDETHVLGAFIADRLLSRPAIIAKINQYLDDNEPLQLSARFFKTEPEYQQRFFGSSEQFDKYQKEVNTKLKRESENRIRFFAKKIDDEYEANENNLMLVQDEKDEEKLWQQNNRNKNKVPEEKCYDVDVMFKL